jgi:spoIIIJ-associated protein
MYNAKLEAREFTGESRQDAVAKACAFFGSDEAGLTVHEAEVGQVFGLGGRTVIVAVPQGAADRSRGPSRDRGRERGRPPQEEERQPREERPREERPREERPREERPAARRSVGTVRGDLGDVGRFVLGAMERMGLGNFEISEAADGEFVVCELRGDGARGLRSGDGRAAEALQLIANQFSAQTRDDAPRVVIDAEGEASDRESSLTRLAERAAKRAQESRRAIALDAMSPADRRIVHLALRDSEGIATMSVGTGRYRQVVVVPEGAPEFDEARRSSTEAREREGR